MATAGSNAGVTSKTEADASGSGSGGGGGYYFGKAGVYREHTHTVSPHEYVNGYPAIVSESPNGCYTVRRDENRWVHYHTYDYHDTSTCPQYDILLAEGKITPADKSRFTTHYYYDNEEYEYNGHYFGHKRKSWYEATCDWDSGHNVYRPENKFGDDRDEWHDVPFYLCMDAGISEGANGGASWGISGASYGLNDAGKQGSFSVMSVGSNVTVRYHNGSDGTGKDSSSVVTGAVPVDVVLASLEGSLVLPGGSQINRPGYRFAGWYPVNLGICETAPSDVLSGGKYAYEILDLAIQYSAGYQVDQENKKVVLDLYAIWVPKTYTLYFNFNEPYNSDTNFHTDIMDYGVPAGADFSAVSGGICSKTVEYNKPIGSLPSPTLIGYDGYYWELGGVKINESMLFNYDNFTSLGSDAFLHGGS